MHIRILQQFLSSLRAPLQSVGAGTEIEPLVAALAPFAELDVAAFTRFLEAADEYRRDGRVRVPSPDDAGLERLGRALAAMRDGVKQGDRSPAGVQDAQTRVVEILSELGKSSGFTITAKPNKKWFDQQRTAARSAELVSRLRALAARIAGPESYAAPELQSEIDSLGSLLPADWKLLEGALAFKASGRGRGKAEAALARLSGHAAPSPTKGKSRAAKQPPSPEQILPHVQRLKDRMERSNDRDLFPRSEVDAQVSELNDLDRDTIAAILREANFTVGARDSKPVMLQKLREFLDAGHRAFERIQA